jgi:hypothetical protein
MLPHGNVCQLPAAEPIAAHPPDLMDGSPDAQLQMNPVASCGLAWSTLA